MEGFLGGGCFGEGKRDGVILVEFWSLWWIKWRWRRKKMMVKYRRYCCCCICNEDEGGVGGFKVLMEE